MGTNIDYSTVSHETIYRHITGGLGGTEMMEASRDWQRVAAQLQEIQILMDRAVRGIDAAQQGAAADAATRATMALMPWVAGTATTASDIAARVGEQAAVFTHTRSSMPPPRTVPEVSFIQDPGTWIADHAVEWLPGIQTEHERAQVAAQQDEQRARELMSGYQDTSNEILAVHQGFVAAPTVVAELAPPAVSPVYPALARPAVTRSATAHAPDSPQGGLPAAALGGGPEGTVTAAASTLRLESGVDHAPAAVSPQLAGDYPRSTGSSAGATPIAASPVLTGSGGGADRVRGGFRWSGGFGPRPRVVFDTGDSAMSRSPHRDSSHRSPGHGSGAQAGAGQSERASTGFANAALGAPVGSGGGGDTVHRRPSYLIEQDTSAIVGELPLLAPPVIGADEDYQ